MALSQQDKEAFLNRINAVETSRQEQHGEQKNGSSAKREWTDADIEMAICLGW